MFISQTLQTEYSMMFLIRVLYVSRSDKQNRSNKLDISLIKVSKT